MRRDLALGPTRVQVDGETILDARLALYHPAERWLAVADVHFGYELSQRASGALFPLWGMDTVETRLLALIDDYLPANLVIAGDFVHDRAGRDAARGLLERLRTRCGVILVAGNHDRRAFATHEMEPVWTTGGFCFHHGDNAPPPVAAGQRLVIGHHHPSGRLGDGTGFSIKLPAFVQTETHWVLPAFSPWAAGGGGAFGPDARLWLCSPQRILPPRVR